MSTKTSEIVWQVDVPGWQIVTLAHSSFTLLQTFEAPTETGMTLAGPDGGAELSPPREETRAPTTIENALLAPQSDERSSMLTAFWPEVCGSVQ
jgi:hypothetical protein